MTVFSVPSNQRISASTGRRVKVQELCSGHADPKALQISALCSANQSENLDMDKRVAKVH